MNAQGRRACDSFSWAPVQSQTWSGDSASLQTQQFIVQLSYVGRLATSMAPALGLPPLALGLPLLALGLPPLAVAYRRDPRAGVTDPYTPTHGAWC